MPIQHFSAISWQEQVNFQWNDDEVSFVLDHHAELDIVLHVARWQWHNSLCISVPLLYSLSLHLDTVSWFWANQSLPFLLNATCLAEKQQIPILVFGLTRPGLEPKIYMTCTILEASTLTIMPTIQFMYIPANDMIWK